MWPFSSCLPSADSCSAPSPRSDSDSLLSVGGLASLLPFLLILVTSHVLATRHLLPRLARSSDTFLDGEDHVLPRHAPEALRQAHAQHGASSPERRLTSALFGATVALAATLASLILAEISSASASAPRSLALGWTVRSLLVLLVALLPWMECRSLLSAAGWRFRPDARGRVSRTAWMLQLGMFAVWLVLFAMIGSVVPDAGGAPVTAAEIAATAAAAKGQSRDRKGGMTLVDMLTTACLERVGIVGICLMALLAGFAAVSTPWYTFGDCARRRGGGGGGGANNKRPLGHADIARREDRLDAAREMLASKRHRLHALGQQGSSASTSSTKPSFFSSLVGSGSSSEERSLRVEIAGLENVEANLASNLAVAKTQLTAEQRSSTTLGRILLVPSYVFSCYCVYRILATSLTTLRRLTLATTTTTTHGPTYSASGFFGGSSAASTPAGSSFSSTDPINRFLGLAARHWDPNLDQTAWARTISFLLSGLMLLLSASSVVQTLRLFSRWAPPVIQRRAQASLALAVGHVAATYVISSALLLRSHLPREMSTSVTGALLARGDATPLLMTPSFADGWFEGWFLVGVAITATAIGIGRSVAGTDPADDDYHDLGHKRS